LIFKKQGGYFAERAAEGVPFMWGRWIADGWPRLNRGEGEEAGQPELGKAAAAPWP